MSIEDKTIAIVAEQAGLSLSDVTADKSLCCDLAYEDVINTVKARKAA